MHYRIQSTRSQCLLRTLKVKRPQSYLNKAEHQGQTPADMQPSERSACLHSLPWLAVSLGLALLQSQGICCPKDQLRCNHSPHLLVTTIMVRKLGDSGTPLSLWFSLLSTQSSHPLRYEQLKFVLPVAQRITFVLSSLKPSIWTNITPKKALFCNTVWQIANNPNTGALTSKYFKIWLTLSSTMVSGQKFCMCRFFVFLQLTFILSILYYFLNALS